MSQYKTVISYALTGGRDFTIPFEYLARKFIIVTLVGDGIRTKLNLNTDYRFSTKTTITTNQTWSVGQYREIEIRRFTSATDRLVNFNDGSILRATDLNLSQIQTLHVAEEARDLTIDLMGLDSNGNFDARNHKIVNLADATNPQDAVTYKQALILEGSAGDAAAVALAAAVRSEAARDISETSSITAVAASATAVNAAHSAKTSEIACVAVQDQMAENWYYPPKNFVAGLGINDVKDTVLYLGSVYSASPAAIPFVTTSTFNPAQWILFSSLSRIELAQPSGPELVGIPSPVKESNLSTFIISTDKASPKSLTYFGATTGSAGLAATSKALKDALESDYQEIIVPSGDYRIAAVSASGSNKRLVGDFLVVDGETFGLRLTGNGNTINNAGARGIAVPVPAASPTYGRELLSVLGDNNILDRLEVFNSTGAGILVNGRGFSVRSVRSHSNQLGLTCGSGSRDFEILGGSFSNNLGIALGGERSGADGILLHRNNKGGKLIGVRMSGNREHGIYYQGSDTLLLGCFGELNGDYAFKFGTHNDQLTWYPDETPTVGDYVGYNNGVIGCSSRNNGLGGVYVQRRSSGLKVHDFKGYNDCLRVTMQNLSDGSSDTTTDLSLKDIDLKGSASLAFMDIALESGQSTASLAGLTSTGTIRLYASNTAPQRLIGQSLTGVKCGLLDLSRQQAAVVTDSIVDEVRSLSNSSGTKLRNVVIKNQLSELYSIEEYVDCSVTYNGTAVLNQSGASINLPEVLDNTTIVAPNRTEPFLIKSDGTMTKRPKWSNSTISAPSSIRGVEMRVNGGTVTGCTFEVSSADLAVDVYGSGLTLTGNSSTLGRINLRTASNHLAVGNNMPVVGNPSNIVANNKGV